MSPVSCIIVLDSENLELFEDVFRNFIFNVALEPGELKPYMKWWQYLKDKQNLDNGSG